MKKFLLVVCCVVLLSGAAYASDYTLSPTPKDFNDFPHEKYLAWKPNWSLPEGETITEAVLTFYNIYDWTKENNDRLYTHLLTTDPKGGKKISKFSDVWYWKDNQKGGDNWDGKGPLIGVWTDPYGGNPNKAINLTYKFSDLGLVDDLNAALTNGFFGIGVDPDCHYYNCGVDLKLTTSVVPEPLSSSLFLLGGALLAVRKFRKKTV